MSSVQMLIGVLPQLKPDIGIWHQGYKYPVIADEAKTPWTQNLDQFWPLLRARQSPQNQLTGKYLNRGRLVWWMC